MKVRIRQRAEEGFGKVREQVLFETADGAKWRSIWESQAARKLTMGSKRRPVATRACASARREQRQRGNGILVPLRSQRLPWLRGL